MRFALIVLVASGCFHPNYDHPACSDGDCPDGLTCVAGRCESSETIDAPGDAEDAPIDVPDGPPVDASTDMDNDGVLNTMDNCPMLANATQANEDGDSFGDVCDPCPIDTDNTDLDNDGVGDKCDPNPSAIGDHIYLFEGFSDTTLPQTLTASGSTWTFASGKASVSSLNTASSLSFPAGGTTETVTTRTTVTSFGNSSSSFVGIADDFKAGSLEGVFCSLLKQNAPQSFSLQVNENPAGGLNTSMATDIFTGTSYKMSLLRDGTLFRCTKDMTTISDTRTGQSPTTPYALLYVSSASATFDYVMVVTSP